MYQNSQLSYYQKNAKEAFERGFTTKLHYEHIEGTGEIYEVHKYYVPVIIAKKIKWLKWYFENLVNDGTPLEHRKHKHWIEYAETSMLMLSRIFHSMAKDQTILAGSEYVSPVAWAIFGRSQRIARHHFKNILDFQKHYHNQLHGICYPIEIHFRIGSEWAKKIANKFQRQPYCSANYWMAVAILLTYDIIQNCGPDGAAEFFELFNNDYRIDQRNYNINFWEQERPFLLGVPAKYEIPSLYDDRRRSRSRPISIEEIKPIRVKTQIELIFEGNALLSNEKTYPTNIIVKNSTHVPLIYNSNSSTNDARFPDFWEDVLAGSCSHGLGIRPFKIGGIGFGNGVLPGMM
jgi:hypothetical protein